MQYNNNAGQKGQEKEKKKNPEPEKHAKSGDKQTDGVRGKALRTIWTRTNSDQEVHYSNEVELKKIKKGSSKIKVFPSTWEGSMGPGSSNLLWGPQVPAKLK